MTLNNLDTGFIPLIFLIFLNSFSLFFIFTYLRIYYITIFRYVGLCAGIKILALALFLIDWWLVRRRRQMEEQPPSFTVNEFVGSIISLDKRE
jgi:hypothetical protein